MSLILKNVRILSENGFSDNKNIVIEQDKIKSIVDSGERISLKGNEIYDVKERTVIPGFMNCHTHLYQTFGRGLMDDLHITQWLELIWQYPKLFSSEAIYYSTLIGAIESIKSGSTVVAELIGDGLPEDIIAQAITDVGLRLVFGKMGNDYPEGENTPVKPTEISLQENEEFFKKWNNKNDGMITVKFSFAGLPACSKELVRGIRELSKKYRVGIHAHAAEGKEPTEQVKKRFGKGEIEALNDLGVLGPTTQLAHVVWLSEEEIEILAKTGTSVIYCPSTNCKITDGISPMYKMWDSGVNITFGVDGAASSSNHDILLEARFGSLLQKVTSLDAKVFDAPSIFKMLTINGSKALGLEGIVGKIEEGYKADLIIVDSNNSYKFLSEDIQLNNLVYGVTGEEIINDVIINGKFMVKNKVLLSMDEKEVLEKARTVFRKEKKNLVSLRGRI